MMRDSWDMKGLTDVRGTDVFSSDGEKIGSVQEIYYDDKTGVPEWIGLGTGFLGMKRRVIPVEVLAYEGDHLLVPYTKEKVQKEPDYDFDDRITDEAESHLCNYFGLTGEHQHTMQLLRPEEDYRGPML